ncbi:hypothetical protein BGX27_010075 [Mortierella sp. AM989]|nr:hypothetical protein BGX27_010075 [Mortierella sp. AM989]
MSVSPPPSSNGSYSNNGVALSANDRRERNKAASAKYRAKKHYQSGEMRTQITELQDYNNVVTRQLEECRAENALLKNQVEKLKGRLVAEKVLKRLREVGREKKRRGGSSAGHATTKVSAQDLSVSDSETDDVVDTVAGVEDDEDEDDVDSVLQDDTGDVEIEKRGDKNRSNTHRKVARIERDNEDYRDN